MHTQTHNNKHTTPASASAHSWCTHLDFSGCCCVSSASPVSPPCSTCWSHYLLTHLSSSKWFLFISCKSPNQSWKLNASQSSLSFQPHSLSLWKWMAAAEASDVLSRLDGASRNASCDLRRWLKALVGDSTNHITHPIRCIGFVYLLCSHLLSVSCSLWSLALKRARTEVESSFTQRWRGGFSA